MITLDNLLPQALTASGDNTTGIGGEEDVMTPEFRTPQQSYFYDVVGPPDNRQHIHVATAM